MSAAEPILTFRVEALEVLVFETTLDMAETAAAHVTAVLRQTLATRGEANLVVATGASQYEFLHALRQAPGLDWSRVTAFHLDEYLGVAADHPASFRRYLHERLFRHVPLRAVHVLEGDAADPQAEARRYADLLARHSPDVVCLGIGENGHLAFNDPPADFDTQALVQVQALDPISRQQQVKEGHFSSLGEVPTHALTLTIPAILLAKYISCVVPDQRKAMAVRAALEGPLSPDCPASILRQAPHARLFLDRPAASLLGAHQLP